MEAKQQTNQETNTTSMKLPILPNKPNTHIHYSLSSPIHSTSLTASVPFSWENEPGKPKQHSSSSSSSSSSLSSYSRETHMKYLELPPRLVHSLLEKDDLVTRSRKMDSPSFRLMVKSSVECYGSFRSEIYDDLDDEEEETKEKKSMSLDLVKKKGGLFVFIRSSKRKKRAMQVKTEFCKGSYVFPSSVERESQHNIVEDEDEEEEEKEGFGYIGDVVTCSQSNRFSEVKVANISMPSSSTKSHFWTNVYAGLKQVVPWKKNKNTTS
ncbi:unnamed protein product [Cochlearia groenlandica]